MNICRENVKLIYIYREGDALTDANPTSDAAVAHRLVTIFEGAHKTNKNPLLCKLTHSVLRSNHITQNSTRADAVYPILLQLKQLGCCGIHGYTWRDNSCALGALQRSPGRPPKSRDAGGPPISSARGRSIPVQIATTRSATVLCHNITSV